MRARGALLAISMAAPGHAQTWVSPEVCDSRTAVIHDAVFDAPALEALRDDAASIPFGTGRFWRISINDAATSYVWGLNASTNPLLLRIPDAVEAAIDEATIIAVEFDFRYRSKAEADAAWVFDPLAPFPPPPNYPSDPRLDRWVRNAFSMTSDNVSNGIPLEDMMTAMGRGEFVTALMGSPCAVLNNGTIPTQGQLILTEAYLQDDWIIGLDDPDSLIEAINAEDGTDLADALLHVFAPNFSDEFTLAEIETSNALFLRGEVGALMVWEAQSLSVLYGETRAQSYLQTAADHLTTQRSHKFADTLADALKEGGVFVGLNAWDLPGKGGFLSELESRGYTVARIPVEGEDP